MPPRYSYWTILAGGLPTAFRAADRDELEPTFRRLREKHPDAEMKWFARGRLWASPEEARIARPPRNRDTRGETGGAHVQRETPARPAEVRGRDWRPGGEHRDPRQRFQDAKKARNAERRQERFARKQGADRWRGGPHHGKPQHARDMPDRTASKDARGARPPRAKPHDEAAPRGPRPFDRKTFPRNPRVGKSPPRPRGPNREPRPGESPRPSPPPRPAEPAIPPPGPPERGKAGRAGGGPRKPPRQR